MVVETLAGWPSLVIVGLLLVGYIASWKHVYVLMAGTALGALLIALQMGSPLGILFNIPIGMTEWELLMHIGPSLMIVISAAAGYIYGFTHKPLHMMVMAVLMITSLVLGW